MRSKFWVVVLSLLIITVGLMIYQVSSKAREIPDGKALTREEIIERATSGLKDPEVVDVRLVLHEEASSAIGVGQFDYEQGFYKKDDPVWLLAIQSENASAALPDIGQGDVKYRGLIYVINAADGEAIFMATMPDEQYAKRVERMRALKDKDGLLEIVPRTPQPLQGSDEPIVPLSIPTNTPLP